MHELFLETTPFELESLSRSLPLDGSETLAVRSAEDVHTHFRANQVVKSTSFSLCLESSAQGTKTKLKNIGRLATTMTRVHLHHFQNYL